MGEQFAPSTPATPRPKMRPTPPSSAAAARRPAPHSSSSPLGPIETTDEPSLNPELGFFEDCGCLSFACFTLRCCKPSCDGWTSSPSEGFLQMIHLETRETRETRETKEPRVPRETRETREPIRRQTRGQTRRSRKENLQGGGKRPKLMMMMMMMKKIK